MGQQSLCCISNPVTSHFETSTVDAVPQSLAFQVAAIQRQNRTPLKTIGFQNNKNFRGTINQKGQRHGYGEYQSQNYNYYGYFGNNLPHGKGVLAFNTKFYYVGQFEKGKINGTGKQVNEDSLFVGEFKDSFKAKGTLTTSQYKYVGSFSQGRFDGNGTLKLADGTYFSGNFKKGKFDGIGTLTFPSKSSYRGRFKEGQYNGYGVYKWDQGKYQGQYKMGQRDGFGRLTSLGSQFAGKWKSGKREGKGILQIEESMGFGMWHEDILQ